MPRFSTKTAQDYYDSGEKEDALWDWVNNSGQGVMGFQFGDIPGACLDFCISQYQRFGIPVTKELHEAVCGGASATFYFMDVVNPYALFEGVSDVNQSTDWATTTYRIFDPVNPDKRSYEPDPAAVESFVFAPGQAEETFNRYIAMPGLAAVPHGNDIIDIMLSDYNYGQFESLSAEGLKALETLCEGDAQKMASYMELGSWAAYLWLIGPESRSFRMYSHDIINMAINDGECLIVEGQFISPSYYTKIDRPPQSCHHCGVQTWCVEHTLTGTHQGFICEACLNFDLPKNRFSNCGSKFCVLSACPNHPYHQMGKQGAFQSRRENGFLLDIAKNKAVHQVMGGTPNYKRLGF